MKSPRKPDILPLRIPNELCQNILNYQFEVDSGNLSEDVVVKTTNLYSEAVNFYLQHSDYSEENLKRAHFYQDKIKKLLGREDVRKVLEGIKVNQKATDMQKQLEKAKQSAPYQAKRLLEYYKNQTNTQSNLIKKTVEEQNQKLELRLSIRSKSKNKQSIASPRFRAAQKKLESPENL